jgi:hypothetical protein
MLPLRHAETLLAMASSAAATGGARPSTTFRKINWYTPQTSLGRNHSRTASSRSWVRPVATRNEGTTKAAALSAAVAGRTAKRMGLRRRPPAVTRRGRPLGGHRERTSVWCCGPFRTSASGIGAAGSASCGLSYAMTNAFLRSWGRAVGAIRRRHMVQGGHGPSQALQIALGVAVEVNHAP